MGLFAKLAALKKRPQGPLLFFVNYVKIGGSAKNVQDVTKVSGVIRKALWAKPKGPYVFPAQ